MKGYFTLNVEAVEKERAKVFERKANRYLICTSVASLKGSNMLQKYASRRDLDDPMSNDIVVSVQMSSNMYIFVCTAPFLYSAFYSPTAFR